MSSIDPFDLLNFNLLNAIAHPNPFVDYQQQDLPVSKFDLISTFSLKPAIISLPQGLKYDQSEAYSPPTVSSPTLQKLLGSHRLALPSLPTHSFAHSLNKLPHRPQIQPPRSDLVSGHNATVAAASEQSRLNPIPQPLYSFKEFQMAAQTSFTTPITDFNIALASIHDQLHCDDPQNGNPPNIPTTTLKATTPIATRQLVNDRPSPQQSTFCHPSPLPISNNSIQLPQLLLDSKLGQMVESLEPLGSDQFSSPSFVSSPTSCQIDTYGFDSLIVNPAAVSRLISRLFLPIRSNHPLSKKSPHYNHPDHNSLQRNITPCAKQLSPNQNTISASFSLFASSQRTIILPRSQQSQLRKSPTFLSPKHITFTPVLLKVDPLRYHSITQSPSINLTEVEPCSLPLPDLLPIHSHISSHEPPPFASALTRRIPPISSFLPSASKVPCGSIKLTTKWSRSIISTIKSICPSALGNQPRLHHDHQLGPQFADYPSIITTSSTQPPVSIPPHPSMVDLLHPTFHSSQPKSTRHPTPQTFLHGLIPVSQPLSTLFEPADPSAVTLPDLFDISLDLTPQSEFHDHPLPPFCRFPTPQPPLTAVTMNLERLKDFALISPFIFANESFAVAVLHSMPSLDTPTDDSLASLFSMRLVIPVSIHAQQSCESKISHPNSSSTLLPPPTPTTHTRKIVTKRVRRFDGFKTSPMYSMLFPQPVSTLYSASMVSTNATTFSNQADLKQLARDDQFNKVLTFFQKTICFVSADLPRLLPLGLPADKQRCTPPRICNPIFHFFSTLDHPLSIHVNKSLELPSYPILPEFSICFNKNDPAHLNQLVPLATLPLITDNNRHDKNMETASPQHHYFATLAHFDSDLDELGYRMAFTDQPIGKNKRGRTDFF